MTAVQPDPLALLRVHGLSLVYKRDQGIYLVGRWDDTMRAMPVQAVHTDPAQAIAAWVATYGKERANEHR